MLYEMECDCGHRDEYMMAMDEVEKWVKCTSCGAEICRRHHRVFHGMRLNIQGDTVSGGCNYDYYDEHLETHIKSKQHRKDEMKRQGVEEYSPDPEMKKLRQESQYIRKHSRDGDVDAVNAVKAKDNEAVSKRRKAIVDKTFSDANLGGISDE